MTEQNQKKLGPVLWSIADTLRGAMDADDFRDYMLAFLFLRYLSDNYESAAKKELSGALEKAKSSGLNIDYFPTNFVVAKNPKVGTEELFYIDYECNDYMEEWNLENWGLKYWTNPAELPS